MTIEGVLITIRSLLDNKPYLHEPNQRDSATSNRYVQYNTWRWLLLDYVVHERDADAKAFLNSYIRQHGVNMISELERQLYANYGGKELTTPYKRGVPCQPSYQTLLAELRIKISHAGQVLSGASVELQVLQCDQRKRKDKMEPS